MSSLAIFILTTFNVLISFFIMRVWCQYLRVSTNNVVARSILLVTRIPVAMLGNKVSRGINLSACGAVVILTIAKLLTEYYVLLSACGAVVILTIAKLLTEYYVLFDLGENIAESGSALTYLIYYVLKPCMFIIKMSAIVLITVCIVDAILSWFGPSPIKYMSSSLLMPIYRQMRKFIPPIGMVDITPMILLFGLYLLEYLVETLLSQMFSASFAFFLCSALV